MELSSSNSISVFDALRQRMMLSDPWFLDAPAKKIRWTDQMLYGLKNHWPEYLMEGAELCLFMISACVVTVVLFHPVSPIAQDIHNEILRRLLMGIAMGSTAIAIVFSPLGKRSGAHFNPAVTLTFLRLGKVKAPDAIFFILFQFAGGIAGVLLASLLPGNLITHQSVNYAATVPGRGGALPAFIAEVVISFILMSVVLAISNNTRLSRWTGLFVGTLLAIYITLESPISGMSMNPARTFGSASVGNIWTSLWIYFTAPLIGMFLAAEAYHRLNPNSRVVCAKLHHHNDKPCIFNCNFERITGPASRLVRNQK